MYTVSTLGSFILFSSSSVPLEDSDTALAASYGASMTVVLLKLSVPPGRLPFGEQYPSKTIAVIPSCAFKGAILVSFLPKTQGAVSKGFMEPRMVG